MAKTTEQRFWSHVQGGSYTECWIWTASLKQDQGYGQFTPAWGLTVAAHLWSYQFMVGPIPDGLQVDHLCHTRDLSCPSGNACLHRRCVNPWHLEPVTPLVNTRRSSGHASQTHCKWGHPFNEENTYLGEKNRLHRQCRECRRAVDRKRQPARSQRRKALVVAKRGK